jgi:hypothetical protein
MTRRSGQASSDKTTLVVLSLTSEQCNLYRRGTVILDSKKAAGVVSIS